METLETATDVPAHAHPPRVERGRREPVRYERVVILARGTAERGNRCLVWENRWPIYCDRGRDQARTIQGAFG